MWHVGDLVFVRITGYPWWPGQVMAKDKVSSKFMALEKDGTHPVNFFGDNEFGWCANEDMQSFNEHYNELSEQKMSRQYRNFKRAVEEAKEIADRRSGNTPVTSHNPVDFLDPSTYPSSEDEGAEAHRSNKDLRPLPLEAEAAKEVTARHALQLLCLAAREQGQTPDQVACHDAAVLRQLLFSYVRRRLVVAQGLGSPPKKDSKGTPAKRKPVAAATPQKKKQRLVKAGSTEKEGKRRVSIKKESAELEDVIEQKPQSQPAAQKPQQPQKQKQEPQAADSDEDDDSAPAITGAEEIKYRPQKLQAFLLRVRACASDQGRHRLLAKNATEFAACLRLREQVYARSRHHLSKHQEWGACVKEAMSMPGLQFAQPPKPRKARRKSGIHVPVPEPHDTAEFYDYAERVPTGSEAFMQQLQDFYARKDALLQLPQVDGQQVDLYRVFWAVAERGGCEAVMLNRQWRAVALDCHSVSSSPQVPVQIRKLYCRLLLAYEKELTQGVPSRSVSKQSKPEETRTTNAAQADKAAQVTAHARRAAATEAPAAQASDVSENSSASEELEDAQSEEEVSEDEPYEEARPAAGNRVKSTTAKQKRLKLKQEISPKESFASSKVHQNAAKKKRRPANGHDAFADLDDEPIPRPQKPKEATDFDVVGEVLNNLRPPGPPLKHLKIKFNQEFELPSQSIVWAIMKDITKDWELKKEAVLLNHLTKSVVVTFRTERHARTAHDFLKKKKIIFKAPKAAVELSLHAPGDTKSKSGKRPQHAAASFRSNGRPAPAYAAPSPPVVPYQDPRRPPAAPQRTSLFSSLAAETRASQPSNVTPIESKDIRLSLLAGDPRLLYGRPVQMGAAAQQPQQQQQQHNACSQAAPAPGPTLGYAQPVDPRRPIPSDPRLGSAPGVAVGLLQPQAGSAQGAYAGGAPAGAQLVGLDLMAILQNAGVRAILQPQAGVRQDPPPSIQAPMLAGEMENMFAAPISNGQWAGQQGGPGSSELRPKTEPGAPGQDSAQGGQVGPQDNSNANMSDQMLQILEQLKRGG